MKYIKLFEEYSQNLNEGIKIDKNKFAADYIQKHHSHILDDEETQPKNGFVVGDGQGIVELVVATSEKQIKNTINKWYDMYYGFEYEDILDEILSDFKNSKTGYVVLVLVYDRISEPSHPYFAKWEVEIDKKYIK